MHHSPPFLGQSHPALCFPEPLLTPACLMFPRFRPPSLLRPPSSYQPHTYTYHCRHLQLSEPKSGIRFSLLPFLLPLHTRLSLCYQSYYRKYLDTYPFFSIFTPLAFLAVWMASLLSCLGDPFHGAFSQLLWSSIHPSTHHQNDLFKSQSSHDTS